LQNFFTGGIHEASLVVVAHRRKGKSMSLFVWHLANLNAQERKKRVWRRVIIGLVVFWVTVIYLIGVALAQSHKDDVRETRNHSSMSECLDAILASGSVYLNVGKKHGWDMRSNYFSSIGRAEWRFLMMKDALPPKGIILTCRAKAPNVYQFRRVHRTFTERQPNENR
jgi:hypothetical protein